MHTYMHIYTIYVHIYVHSYSYIHTYVNTYIITLTQQAALPAAATVFSRVSGAREAVFRRSA